MKKLHHKLPAIDNADLLMRSCKWVIMVFDREGKSYKGSDLYDSKRDVNTVIFELQKHRKIWIDKPSGTVLINHAYAIPYPVIK